MFMSRPVEEAWLKRPQGAMLLHFLDNRHAYILTLSLKHCETLSSISASPLQPVVLRNTATYLSRAAAGASCPPSSAHPPTAVVTPLSAEPAAGQPANLRSSPAAEEPQRHFCGKSLAPADVVPPAAEESKSGVRRGHTRSPAICGEEQI